MNKLPAILTCCSILGACASGPEPQESATPLIDFATIASQIEVRVETLQEIDRPAEPILAVADSGR